MATNLREVDGLTCDVAFDQGLYDRIVGDMEECGGALAPADMWRLERLFPESEADQRSPSFQALIEPWIGQARRPATAAQIAACEALLESVDPQGDSAGRFRQWLAMTTATKADARTALEHAVVIHFGGEPTPDPLRIIEIGGGYGRLAEAFVRFWGPGSIRYVLLDAVPASLYYAHAYLRQALPDASVASYYVDEDRDIDRHDVFVCPIWHFDALETAGFDVGLNIASMQEMRADQVDACLTMLDEHVHEGGIVLLSNTRDYGYGHDYVYPVRWRLLMKRNTPLLAWPHSPIEVFSRQAEPAEHENALVEARYAREVTQAYRRHIKDLRSRYERSIGNLRGRVARQEDALKTRAAAVSRLTQENARLRSGNDALRRQLAEARRRKD
jgi:SAM-dependent methyltransferase